MKNVAIGFSFYCKVHFNSYSIFYKVLIALLIFVQ